MQKDIHPKYFPAAIATCACGKTYAIGSTKEKIEVEICSACHPFYTGTEKSLDAAGRVEKFKNRKAQAKAPAPKPAKPAEAPKAKKADAPKAEASPAEAPAEEAK